MNTNRTITASAAGSALMIIASAFGGAGAQELNGAEIDNDILMENIHHVITETQHQAFELVLAKAEMNIELKVAKIENFITPKPVKNLAGANSGL